MLRIRIFYYADPDPGFKKCPYRSGSGSEGVNQVSDPDPHKEMPPGSGSAWTDADPDPGGKKT